MPKWVNVMEVVNDKELSKRYVQYRSRGGKICFREEDTGFQEKQWGIAETKMNWNNFGWKLFLISDNEPALISYPTDFKLKLSGPIGYENSKVCFMRYASLYHNEEAGTIGEVLNEDIYEKLPEHLKFTLGSYWLNDNYKDDWSLGIKAVISGEKRNVPLCGKEAKAPWWEYQMRIVIREIPLDTIIDIGDPYEDGSTEYRAMKMVMNPYLNSLQEITGNIQK